MSYDRTSAYVLVYHASTTTWPQIPVWRLCNECLASKVPDITVASAATGLLHPVDHPALNLTAERNNKSLKPVALGGVYHRPHTEHNMGSTDLSNKL